MTAMTTTVVILVARKLLPVELQEAASGFPTWLLRWQKGVMAGAGARCWNLQSRPVRMDEGLCTLGKKVQPKTELLQLRALCK